MSIDSLNGLFVEEMKDLYNAEKQIVKALPKLIKESSSPELQAAFEQHLALTERHVERLEEVFGRLGLAPQEKLCKGVAGLIEEGSEMMKMEMAPSVIETAQILQKTLDEEGDADRKLTELAEFSVNLQAAAADMEEVES